MCVQLVSNNFTDCIQTRDIKSQKITCQKNDWDGIWSRKMQRYIWNANSFYSQKCPRSPYNSHYCLDPTIPSDDDNDSDYIES